MASSAASAAASNFSGGAKQAIGKPLDGLASPATHSDINWVDFNYPPLLRLIHFNMEELPTSLTGIVRCFNVSFQLTTFTCLISLVNTVILVASVQAPAKGLVQCAIHALVLPASALLIFYSGYRGLAEPDSKLASRFKVGQPVLAFLYFLLGVLPYGCINGLAKLGDTGDSVYVLIVILLESLLWLGNCALAAWNTVRAQRFDSYESGAANRF
eukprot:TRINITY_DN30009_c0_g1_i1.p1 TRINITY_DN30009_c0_g1~~TRINITY_DN30009_c0_g1_i1.p1  ORF type:complete len:229 (-),score=34.79 TRINITY_DN30009_c0_g1_i1:91-732(-)